MSRSPLDVPAETAAELLTDAAHSFVLAHNHPSGDPTPTREDEATTLELRHLSAELEVPLKAHVIVTPSGRYAVVFAGDARLPERLFPAFGLPMELPEQGAKIFSSDR